MQELVTAGVHATSCTPEYIGGLPTVINALLGKTYAPNQAAGEVDPGRARGLRGVGPHETAGGSARRSGTCSCAPTSSKGLNIAPLDVFSNSPRRWPQGNIYYVYGSFFMQWMIETYGEAALRRMIDDYGSQLVPYGVNRSVKRATGPQKFEDMYPSFIDTAHREVHASRSSRYPCARPPRRGSASRSPATRLQRAPAMDPGERVEGARGGPPLLPRRRRGSRRLLRAPGRARRGRSGEADVKDKKRELMIRMDGDGSVSFTLLGGRLQAGQEITQATSSPYNDLSIPCAPGVASPDDLARASHMAHGGVPQGRSGASPDGRRGGLRDEPPRDIASRDRRPRP